MIYVSIPIIPVIPDFAVCGNVQVTIYTYSNYNTLIGRYGRGLEREGRMIKED